MQSTLAASGDQGFEAVVEFARLAVQGHCLAVELLGVDKWSRQEQQEEEQPVTHSLNEWDRFGEFAGFHV